MVAVASITPDADGYTGDGADATGNGATANGGRDGSPLKWLDMSNWDSEPVPERKWAIRDRVPLNQAGLFSGEGGTGKSIIELMKNVAHVAGKDWLGSMPEPGPAFYLGAEDDEDEIHIRLAAIAKHYGVTFKELIEGGLHVLPLLGQDATLCAASGKSGRVEVTDLYRQLYEAAGDIKPKNISIDTLSPRLRRQRDRPRAGVCLRHAHAGPGHGGRRLRHGPEPSQPRGHQHRARASRARPPGTAPSASGSTSKASRPTDGEQPDNDLRELEFKKNQYGPLGETIVLRYQRRPVPARRRHVEPRQGSARKPSGGDFSLWIEPGRSAGTRCHGWQY